jgi:hypothetical protein
MDHPKAQRLRSSKLTQLSVWSLLLPLLGVGVPQRWPGRSVDSLECFGDRLSPDRTPALPKFGVILD